MAAQTQLAPLRFRSAFAELITVADDFGVGTQGWRAHEPSPIGYVIMLRDLPTSS